MTDVSGAPRSDRDREAPARRPRSAAILSAIAIFAVVAFSGFVALGVWQLERRDWKHALIARVEARLRADPVAAPGPADWRAVSPERDEYRRVHVTGVFDDARETFVQAVTELGGGFWVLTPLRAAEGFSVLVNRGFVPPDKRDRATRIPPAAPTTVTGLMRMSEPKGGFLRDNEPAAGLWRSRDVAAIAAALGLSDAAPYFIDADATPNPGGWPVGGMTVVTFSDSHLVYALTWFALAAMTAAGAALVARHEIRLRRA